MDKKVFKKISDEVFKEYGFKKIGKNYILILEDVSIRVVYRVCRGIKSFDYTYAIHALHDPSVPYEDRYNCAIEKQLEHTPSLRGSDKHDLLFEQYEETEYRELLENTLHRYFDPFKKNALQYLKENADELYLRKEGREYLGIIKR